MLMVLGHSGFPFTHFIYQFHMALFFMASGYCWNRGNCERIESVKKYVIKQVKTLYLPYVITNIIFLALNNLFLDINFYTDNIEILKYAGADYEYLGSYLGLSEFCKQLIRIIFFMGGTQLGGATWFLRPLFFVKVGHCIFEFFIEKLNNKIRLVLVGSACFACCVAYDMQRVELVQIPSVTIKICILGYIMYVLGIFMRYFDQCFRYTWWMGIASFVCIGIFSQFGGIALSEAYVPNVIYYIIVSLCGWYLTMYVSKLIERTKYSDLFVYIGKHTMPIVLFHFLCFKIVSLLYLLAFNGDMILLAYFPSLKSENWLWIFYTLVGLFLPLILHKGYDAQKRKLLSVFF